MAQPKSRSFTQRIGGRYLTLALFVTGAGVGIATPSFGETGEVVKPCFVNDVRVIGTPGEQRIEVICSMPQPSRSSEPNSPHVGARTVTRFALPSTDSNAKRFMKLATLAHDRGLVLNVSYHLDGSNGFPGCAGNDASCRRAIYFSISKTGKLCPGYDLDRPSDQLTNWCTADCPCEVNQGDCDSDGQCAGDLYCKTDSGEPFGLPAHFETCQPKQCNGIACNPAIGCPCFQGEACSNDDQCAGFLICTAGTCQPCSPTAPCSTRCPCPSGRGDCDPDPWPCGDGGTCLTDPPGMSGQAVPASNQCRSKACMLDVGAQYGLSQSADVCVPWYRTPNLL